MNKLMRFGAAELSSPLSEPEHAVRVSVRPTIAATTGMLRRIVISISVWGCPRLEGTSHQRWPDGADANLVATSLASRYGNFQATVSEGTPAPRSAVRNHP